MTRPGIQGPSRLESRSNRIGAPAVIYLGNLPLSPLIDADPVSLLTQVNQAALD